MKEVLFHQDNAPAYKLVVAMAAVRDCRFKLVIHPHILLIWHHPTIFCSQTWKTTWLGSSTGLILRSYLLLFRLRTFWWSGWKLLYHLDPSAATLLEEVCGPKGRLCWKINHLCFYSTIASLWAMNCSAHPRMEGTGQRGCSHTDYEWTKSQSRQV